ncbi:hypothetical protein GGX14DRAFT_659346 [Mycena pura]|uniref:F-box domain-containing protein n=1 Tax=Mycena pura TaxID=153505 RepID=A0AAD6Y620_9AGAR|nr:hypothetical protein GGX14DRAFT_659346 [Mycena pura]
MKSSRRDADFARLGKLVGELAGIAGEIEDLSERLGLGLSVQALRSEEANIRKRLYKDPARVLPTEIISEIFVHVLPAYPICPPLAGKSSPTQLTHVCRQWREIAKSTPLLWCAMTIPRFRDDSWARTMIVFFVKTWLHRSGSCPLSISIKEPFGLDGSLEGVIKAVVPHRMRWQFLSFYLLDLESCDNLLEIIRPMPMPLLCEMKFQSSDDICPESVPPSLPAAFRQAPSLRSMTLDLEGIPYSDCTKVLQQTVNLVHCKLRPPDGDEGYEISIDSGLDTRLPRLESLELVGKRYGANSAEYLGTLIVPVLLRLQVPVLVDPDSLSAFIAKAGCKLQELRITSPTYSPSPHLARYYRRNFAFIPRLFYNEIFLDEEYEDDEDFETSDDSDEEPSYSNRDDRSGGVLSNVAIAFRITIQDFYRFLL